MPSGVRICPHCMLEHPASLRCEEAQAEHLRLMKAREAVRRENKNAVMRRYWERKRKAKRV